jgi:hypothetical protein
MTLETTYAFFVIIRYSAKLIKRQVTRHDCLPSLLGDGKNLEKSDTCKEDDGMMGAEASFLFFLHACEKP